MTTTLHETPLQEVYGDNYVSEFVAHNRRYVADLLVSNIAGMNFREVKHDYSVLFGQNKQLPDKWLNHISKRVAEMRPNLIVSRITDLNAVPRLLNEPQITYLKIIDMFRKNVYILFITPYIMDAL